MSVAQLQPVSQLIYVRDLLRELVSRDLKIRYKRSALGLAWAVINPLAQILIFTFLFSKVLPLNIPNYTVFVFSGVLAWNWFQSSLYLAAGAIVDNRDLVRRPGFPVVVLPAVTVATNMIQYLLALPVLFIFLLIDGSGIAWTMTFLPILMVLQFLLTLGFSYFIAAMHVTFRDTQHILSIVLVLLFYLTPVFYRSNAVPEEYQLIYSINPMAHLIGAYRAIMVTGTLPDAGALAYVAGFALIVLAIGHTVFRRASDRFVEEI